jgi:hypothetical protein
LEAPERLEAGKWALAVVGLDRRQVDERCTVVELEGDAVKPVGLAGLQLA